MSVNGSGGVHSHEYSCTSVQFFTTCPPYSGSDSGDYTARVSAAALWSEEAGAEGILVYTDNGLVDPWLTAQIIIQSTTKLSPLVAVQPTYMHPFTAAKMVSTLSYLHGRRVSLNFVAGGFKNDLLALSDNTPHDRRYDRLAEYIEIVQRLLGGHGPVSFQGEFYRVNNLTLKPSLPAQLFPLMTISGSSEAGLSAARRTGAVPVMYPEPPAELARSEHKPCGKYGVRVGIIARQSEEESWEIAEHRFPADHAGEIRHNLAMKVSDSVWHRTLSETAVHLKSGERSPYWLRPFQHYKTFCPYLVGSAPQVAAQIAGYISAGCHTFILDVPASAEDLWYAKNVFEMARKIPA